MDNVMVFIGCDPGLSGAICALHDGNGFECWDTPVAKRTDGRHDYLIAAMVDTLLAATTRFASGTHEVLVVLEYVTPMPRAERGVIGAYALGRGVGLWEGIAAALRLPYVRVTPVVWKRHFGLLKQAKDASRLEALRRFPQAGDWLCRKKDVGRADALLLAAFAREKGLGAARAA